MLYGVHGDAADRVPYIVHQGASVAVASAVQGARRGNTASWEIAVVLQENNFLNADHRWLLIELRRLCLNIRKND